MPRRSPATWTYADLDRLVGRADVVRHVMNAWPPFLFAGIRVTQVSDDFRHVTVRLAKNPLTSNYVGTQFGGSLFSMCDPFWMMTISRALGAGYVVWDKHAEIEFVAPGRAAVTTTFELTEEVLDEIRAETADGAKHLRWFSNDIVTDDGTLVARVRKQVYVRRRREG